MNCNCCSINESFDKKKLNIIIEKFDTFKNKESITKYSDDDVIDINNIDLYEVFNIVVHECFMDEIKTTPFPYIHIGLFRSKHTRANYKVTYNPRTHEILEQSLNFNKNVNWTKRSLLNVMAHELIHYHMYLKGHFKEQHGYRFKSMMNKINDMDKGYNITIRDEEFEFSDEAIENKAPLYVLVSPSNLFFIMRNIDDYDKLSNNIDILMKYSSVYNFTLHDLKLFKTKNKMAYYHNISKKPKITSEKLYDVLSNDLESTEDLTGTIPKLDE